MKLDEGTLSEDSLKPMGWFSHDSNAASDVKCRKLLRRCGMAGYGRWWRLCEMLASNSGHSVSARTEEELEMLADDLMFDDPTELVDFLSCLCEIGLLSGMGDGEFSSDRMMENAAKFGKKRAAGKMGGRPRKASQETYA